MARLIRILEYYRQRQQIIEHQFGTLEGQWYFDYTLTKGKRNYLVKFI